jgi:hypothetical protein
MITTLTSVGPQSGADSLVAAAHSVAALMNYQVGFGSANSPH